MGSVSVIASQLFTFEKKGVSEAAEAGSGTGGSGASARMVWQATRAVKRHQRPRLSGWQHFNIHLAEA